MDDLMVTLVLIYQTLNIGQKLWWSEYYNILKVSLGALFVLDTLIPVIFLFEIMLRVEKFSTLGKILPGYVWNIRILCKECRFFFSLEKKANHGCFDMCINIL